MQNTSLKQVQHFAWSHAQPDLMIAIPPRERDEAEQSAEPGDQLEFKTVVVDHTRNDACFPPDGSVIFSANNLIEEVRAKPRLHAQRRRAGAGAEGGQNKESESSENREPLEVEERFLQDDTRLRIRDVQRHRPFRQAAAAPRRGIEKDLQRWFSRTDINSTAYARALKGYGFGRTAGSARALIENSYNAIKDEKDENERLKECWRLLIRVYIQDASSRLQKTYGTL